MHDVQSVASHLRLVCCAGGVVGVILLAAAALLVYWKTRKARWGSLTTSPVSAGSMVHAHVAQKWHNESLKCGASLSERT
jgi:hypothetical protein